DDLDFGAGEVSDEDELDDGLSFGEDDDLDEATAATTVAPSSLASDDLEDSLDFGADEDAAEQETQVTQLASKQSLSEEPLPHGQMLGSLGQPELLRLQATIKQLREERNGLIAQMDDYKGNVRLLEQDKLTLK